MATVRLTDLKRHTLRRLIMADVPDNAEKVRLQVCALILTESLKQLPVELRRLSDASKTHLATLDVNVRSPLPNGQHVFYAKVYGAGNGADAMAALAKRPGAARRLNSLIAQYGHMKGEWRKIEVDVRAALSAHSTVASLVKAYPEWAGYIAKISDVPAAPSGAPMRDDALVSILTRAKAKKPANKS